MEEPKLTKEVINQHVTKAADEVQQILVKHLEELGLNNTTSGWLFACRVINVHASNLYRPVLQMAFKAEEMAMNTFKPEGK